MTFYMLRSLIVTMFRQEPIDNTIKITEDSGTSKTLKHKSCKGNGL